MKTEKASRLVHYFTKSGLASGYFLVASRRLFAFSNAGNLESLTTFSKELVVSLKMHHASGMFLGNDRNGFRHWQNGHCLKNLCILSRGGSLRLLT